MDKNEQRKSWTETDLQRGIISSSISRVQREYSVWRAVIGWTAWALLIVSALASDSPIYLILPSSTNFLSSLIWNSEMMWTFMWERKFFPHNLTERKITYSFFNRYILIYAVAVVKINVVHLKPLQTSLTAEASIFWSTIDCDIVSRIFHNAKLCCKLNLLSI